MGDIADGIIDGELCELCCCVIDGEETGYPRTCGDCKSDFDDELHERPKHKPKPKPKGPVAHSQYAKLKKENGKLRVLLATAADDFDAAGMGVGVDFYQCSKQIRDGAKAIGGKKL